MTDLDLVRLTIGRVVDRLASLSVLRRKPGVVDPLYIFGREGKIVTSDRGTSSLTLSLDVQGYLADIEFGRMDDPSNGERWRLLRLGISNILSTESERGVVLLGRGEFMRTHGWGMCEPGLWRWGMSVRMVGGAMIIL